MINLNNTQLKPYTIISKIEYYKQIKVVKLVKTINPAFNLTQFLECKQAQDLIKELQKLYIIPYTSRKFSTPSLLSKPLTLLVLSKYFPEIFIDTIDNNQNSAILKILYEYTSKTNSYDDFLLKIPALTAEVKNQNEYFQRLLINTIEMKSFKDAYFSTPRREYADENEPNEPNEPNESNILQSQN